MALMPRPKAARATFVRNDTAAWLLPIFLVFHCEILGFFGEDVKGFC